MLHINLYIDTYLFIYIYLDIILIYKYHLYRSLNVMSCPFHISNNCSSSIAYHFLEFSKGRFSSVKTTPIDNFYDFNSILIENVVVCHLLRQHFLQSSVTTLYVDATTFVSAKFFMSGLMPRESDIKNCSISKV